MLVEVLIALVLFAIGVLSLVAFQGTAVNISGEAKARSDAAFFANQLIARMWTDRTNLASYALNAAAPACEAAANANVSAYAPVQNWLFGVQGDAGTPGQLPRADGVRQQILIGGSNEVTVTLCWQNQAGELRRYVARSQVRFN
jgi:type IV pilus assembly protein PilV